MCGPASAQQTGAPGATPPPQNPVDMTGQYNTLLSPAEESDYQKEHDPRDSYDYDMRGAFKQGITAAGNGHFPDTFKKPNHPTFSDQSIYHGKNGYTGGSWGTAAGRDTYTPSQTNLDMHGTDGIKGYFGKVEPDVVLMDRR